MERCICSEIVIIVIRDTLEPMWPSWGFPTLYYFPTLWHMLGASKDLVFFWSVVLAWKGCSVRSLMTFTFFSRSGQKTFCISFLLLSNVFCKLLRESDVSLLPILTEKKLQLENKLFQICKLTFSAAFYSCRGRQSLILPNLKTCLVRNLQV